MEKKLERLDEFLNELPYKNEWDAIRCKDGLVNQNEYLNSRVKILWILKESNNIENLVEKLRNKIDNGKLDKGWYRTFQKIIQTSHGILEGKKWNEFPNHRKSKAVLNSLSKIGIINLRKYAGSSRANMDLIKRAHEKYKKYTLKQIEVFNPDIIICGGTFKIIKNDFGLKSNEAISKQKKPKCNVYTFKNKLFFDVYHPNYAFNEQLYCDSIIEKSLDWLKEKQ